jgi:non-ribosomal peptide synthetase component F
MFTSGSTGMPKGIWVAQESVQSYLDFVTREYAFTPEDRFSQAFPLTFDPSVHDLFACWGSGAALYCLPKKSWFIPGNFIREHRLTCWYSVPSVVMMMTQVRALKPDLFPSLRLSLFVGEQFYTDWARKWHAAAPNSRIDNVYGPTETTVVIARHRWSENDPDPVVPIGRVFTGQHYRVLDPQGQPVPAGTPGELYLAGSQVSLGYLKDPQRQRESFKRMDSQLWYRSGDLVTDNNGTLTFQGRADNQVKVRSQRVELSEIDAVVRRVSGSTHAVTLAWPIEHNRAENLYTFLLGPTEPFDSIACLRACQTELPQVMVPRYVWPIDRFPLNANGKVDRARLTEILVERLSKIEGTNSQ